jgi:hypothetical protein
VTLHVEYDNEDTELQGTDFVLAGVSDMDMTKAKSLFLRFAGEEVLETGAYGQILERCDGAARVYILGVLASEEPNFLFSYDITSLTHSMKKRLNRERLNVGRTTYSDRVKAILKNASSERVKRQLVEQIKKRATGAQCDEMGWIEISQMALNLMHQQSQVVYFTETELQSRHSIFDNARSDGYEVVVISEDQKTRLQTQILTGGPLVRTVDTYVQEYNSSFQYAFVEYGTLTSEEQRVYDMTPRILALVGITGSRTPIVRISDTMRVTTDDTEGVWDNSISAIVIKRSKLSSVLDYAATLLHEAAHAATGADDATREFEHVLTDYLGQTAAAAINQARSARD